MLKDVSTNIEISMARSQKFTYSIVSYGLLFLDIWSGHPNTTVHNYHYIMAIMVCPTVFYWWLRAPEIQHQCQVNHVVCLIPHHHLKDGVLSWYKSYNLRHGWGHLPLFKKYLKLKQKKRSRISVLSTHLEATACAVVWL